MAVNTFHTFLIAIAAHAITITTKTINIMTIIESNTSELGQASRVSKWVLIAYIVFSALAVIGALGVGLAGSWVQEAANRESAGQIASVQAEANTKIEQARTDAKKELGIETQRLQVESNEKIEKARTDAKTELAIETKRIEAAANEKIAATNERAQALENENLKMKGTIANLEIEAANAKRAYLELQERVKPRHFNAEQRAAFIAVLRTVPKTPVAVLCGDSEACGFAEQIVGSLREAGWDDISGGDVRMSNWTPQFFGVMLSQKHAGTVTPLLEVLDRAFKAASIECTLGNNDALSEGQLLIRVGIKP